MSKANEYRSFIDSLRASLGYWKSYSLMEFTLSITRMMRSDKISGRRLAALLGMSPAQVSKVLSGNENITIETMAKFADALGAVVHVHVAKRGVQVRWSELPPGDISAHLSTKVIDFSARASRVSAGRAKLHQVQDAHLEEAYG